MTDLTEELERLRTALGEAERQKSLDGVIIDALRLEIKQQRRDAQHHVRNVLSVVRSIVRRTAEEGAAGEDSLARLDSRLASFTRLQSHVLRDQTASVDLCTLVADELLTFGIGLGANVHVEGEPVQIRTEAAAVLGLGFHELARMAIERSASASFKGRIVVSWRFETAEPAQTALVLDWVEVSGRKGAESAPESIFGREVLEQAIAYELAGSVHLDANDGGLTCQLRLPGDILVSSPAA